MKTPLSWLNEYTNVDIDVEEYRALMLSRGFELSAQSQLDGIENVVAGRIEALTKHPNADALLICRMDVGAGEPIQVVTGADNVYEGALVPVALHGALLSGGLKIKSGKLRGELSEGMLCSAQELGLGAADYPGAAENGILIIKEDCAPGTPINRALGMDDVVLEFEILPNRPDCQSVLGVARESAAALKKPFAHEAAPPVKGEGSINDYARVDVEAPDLCPRYACRVVTDIKIEPSPQWMQKRLSACGVRPINNIVDITNYVMLEYGQPMHAFDLACVKNGHIIVRRAKDGEQTTTLDGKQHTLGQDMLVIADADGAVGIAGVMGGENSEITQSTKAVLFESALFESGSISKTSKALGIPSEAATRFAKGIDPVTPALALERATSLVAQLGAGKVIGGMIDVCGADLSPRTLTVRVGKINSLLALELTIGQMAEILQALYMDVKQNADTLEVTLAHYRMDIRREADIAEEIARSVGYDKIPMTLVGGRASGGLTKRQSQDDALKDALVACGAYETYNFSFMAPSVFDKLMMQPDHPLRAAVRLQNPFGEDQSLMRTLLLPGMLQSALVNLSRKQKNCRLFEAGNTHLDAGEELPLERAKLGVLIFGEGEDFYTLKGIIERVTQTLGITGASYVPGGEGWFHPGRKALLMVNGREAGQLGELHPEVLERFDVPGRVYYAELDTDTLLKGALGEKAFNPLPRFPAAERDIAVVVKREVLCAQLQKTIKKAAGAWLESVELFDAYEGAKLPQGSKSVAFKLVFRAAERTLKEEEIAPCMQKVLAALEAEFGAALRE